MYKLCNFSKAESLIQKLDFFFFWQKKIDIRWKLDLYSNSTGSVMWLNTGLFFKSLKDNCLKQIDCET